MNQSAAAQSGDGTSVTGPAPQSLSEPSASRPVASDPRDKRPSVPDHELLSRIGGGSYGDVWLAKNAVGTLRAVKVVHRQSFDRDEHFEREFRGLQKFEPLSRSHEGFVDVLQLGRNDQAGYFYYVMELADGAEMTNAEIRNPKEVPNPNVKGTDAREAMRASDFGFPSTFVIRHSDLYTPRTLRHDLKHRCRLPLADCLQIGLGLADALAHLHGQGLVHRDIKPSNIIFVNGAPKLADIGLVTSIDDAHSLVGTVGYIPPEGPGSPQADIYSLGKVLYEAAFGKDRQDFPQLPAELQSHPDHAGLLELNEVITKACESDARRRYQSAAQMRADLDLLQRGESVRRKRALERRLSFAKRIAVTFAVLAMLVGALLFVPSFKAHKAPNAEVLRLYQLSRLHLDKATKEGKQQALECINRALQIDPNFTPGYATLLEIYFWGGLVPDQDKKIRECARKLMELDSTLAESHMAVSWVKFMDGDWQGAEKEIRQAIKLNPNYAPASGLCGFYLALLGRAEESQARFKRAQELDPASRDLAATAGYSFLTARQYEQAIAQVRKALALDPNWAAAHQVIAQIYEDWGKYPEAIGEFEKSELLSTREPAQVLERFNVLRQAFADRGAKGYWMKKRDLMDALGEFVDVKDLPGERSYYLAKLYAHLQDTEQALLWLERARTEDHDMVWLKVEPCWDLVREDPRFIALAKEAGLQR